VSEGPELRALGIRPLIIGVAGGSGSGKTTVARAIHDALSVDTAFIDQDASPLGEVALQPADEPELRRRRSSRDTVPA